MMDSDNDKHVLHSTLHTTASLPGSMDSGAICKLNNTPDHSVCSTPGESIWIDLHYLPCITYFRYLLPYRIIKFSTQALYKKQTYHNRCYILTSQGVTRLTVPVRKGASKLPYSKIEINQDQPWTQLHWRTLCTAYRKAPYFDYFADYFHKVLSKEYTYLFDLNLALFQTCLQLLQLEKRIELIEADENAMNTRVVDERYNIHPRNRLSQSNVQQATPYLQVFGTTFHANLSIIDLLFCQGQTAIAILRG